MMTKRSGSVGTLAGGVEAWRAWWRSSGRRLEINFGISRPGMCQGCARAMQRITSEIPARIFSLHHFVLSFVSCPGWFLFAVPRIVICSSSPKKNPRI